MAANYITENTWMAECIFYVNKTASHIMEQFDAYAVYRPGTGEVYQKVTVGDDSSEDRRHSHALYVKAAEPTWCTKTHAVIVFEDWVGKLCGWTEAFNKRSTKAAETRAQLRLIPMRKSRNFNLYREMILSGKVVCYKGFWIPAIDVPRPRVAITQQDIEQLVTNSIELQAGQRCIQFCGITAQVAEERLFEILEQHPEWIDVNMECTDSVLGNWRITYYTENEIEKKRAQLFGK